MKGKPLAERIRAEVAEEVKKLGHVGLVTVLVGDDPASEVYIRLKHRAAVEAGFDATDLRLPADTTEKALLAKLDELNGSGDVDAILVQLPLPKHIDEARIIRAVTPSKDSSPFSSTNFQRGSRSSMAVELRSTTSTVAIAPRAACSELDTLFKISVRKCFVSVG